MSTLPNAWKQTQGEEEEALELGKCDSNPSLLSQGLGEDGNLFKKMVFSTLITYGREF